MRYRELITSSREQAGLNMSQLAKLVEVSVVHIKDIESGRRLPSDLLSDKLINALKLDKVVTNKALAIERKFIKLDFDNSSEIRSKLAAFIFEIWHLPDEELKPIAEKFLK